MERCRGGALWFPASISDLRRLGTPEDLYLQVLIVKRCRKTRCFNSCSVSLSSINIFLFSNVTRCRDGTSYLLTYGMVWYGMVNVNLYSALSQVKSLSNALNTLVSREKPGFQALPKGLIVLLCAEVVRQGVPDHGAVHSECPAANSG